MSNAKFEGNASAAGIFDVGPALGPSPAIAASPAPGIAASPYGAAFLDVGPAPGPGPALAPGPAPAWIASAAPGAAPGAAAATFKTSMDKCLHRCILNVDTTLLKILQSTTPVPEPAIVDATDVAFTAVAPIAAAPGPAAGATPTAMAKVLLKEEVPSVQQASADRLALLGYSSDFRLGLESASSKTMIWQTTDFDAFKQSLTKTGMPRIGFVEVQNPSPALQAEGGDSGSRIVAVLWSLDSHPSTWRALYESAFKKLQRQLPDNVRFMVVRTDADLTAANLYKSAKANSLDWNNDGLQQDSVALTSGSKLRGSQANLNVAASADTQKILDDFLGLHSYQWVVFSISPDGQKGAAAAAAASLAKAVPAATIAPEAHAPSGLLQGLQDFDTFFTRSLVHSLQR